MAVDKNGEFEIRMEKAMEIMAKEDGFYSTPLATFYCAYVTLK